MDKAPAPYYACGMLLRGLFLPGLMFFCLFSPAFAEEAAFFPRDQNRLVLGIGAYNFTDTDSSQRYPTYHAELRLSEIPVWKLHPWIGFEYQITDVENVDIDSFWIGGGLEADIDLYDDWLVLTLQTGAGYFSDGPDIDTGWQYLPNDGLEFRHQAELGVRFGDGWRAALGVAHMSNANLRSNNNSINSVTLNIHVPLSGGYRE